jgi:C4-dicarboxylate-specific signal transduction histidine kinase
MSKNQPESVSSTSLERALDHNVAIQDTVEQSAAELCLINTVLKQEVPGHVQTGEVAQALQKTDELESRIQASADDLAQVNEALKQEVCARAELERQLASTQAALEQAQDVAQEPSPHGNSQDFSPAQSATR